MKTIEETMSIRHLENNNRKINILEENEIIKAASYKYLLNDVIAGQNDPMYKLLPISDLNSKVNSPDQATKEISKPNNEIISDLNSVYCPSQKTEGTRRPVENVALTTKFLQEIKQLVSGTTVEK
jgi:hypothetical protein